MYDTRAAGEVSDVITVEQVEALQEIACFLSLVSDRSVGAGIELDSMTGLDPTLIAKDQLLWQPLDHQFALQLRALKRAQVLDDFVGEGGTKFKIT